jgi:hypothetical protein
MHIQTAGTVQGVNDAGDLKDKGETIASILVLNQCRFRERQRAALRS